MAALMSPGTAAPALALAALLGGPATSAAPPASATPATNTAATPPVVSPAGFRAALDAERGHVVLVNLWASWCAPCLREIPALLELERTWSGCGLRVVGLALDEPALLATAVVPAIARYFPAFRTLARDAASPDSFASVLDGAWNEVMPTSYVVTAAGQVAQRIQGGKPYAVFEAAVRPHLACPAS